MSAIDPSFRSAWTTECVAVHVVVAIVTRAGAATGLLTSAQLGVPAAVTSLGLAAAQLGDWEEVVDPGGGDAEDFLACAREIVELVGRLAPKLAGCRTT